MKKLHINALTAAVACLILLLQQPASAQEIGQNFKDKTPQQRAQVQTAMMKSKLNMDSGQVTAVHDINLKYALKMEPILKGDGGRFKRMREAESIQKAKDADLKKIFTPAQYKQYEAFESEMKEKLKAYMN